MAIFKELTSVLGFEDPELQKELESGNKPYLVLLKETAEEPQDDDSYQEYQAFAIRGRENVFNILTEQLGSYDLLHSYILSGKIPLGKEVSVYSFLRLCLETHFKNASKGITVDELNYMVYETNDYVSKSFDLDAFYTVEINKRAKA